SKADALHPASVAVCGQLPDTFHAFLKPVLRILLRPARMRERERILLRHNLEYAAGFVHQKQLDSGSSQIDSDKHNFLLSDPSLRVHSFWDRVIPILGRSKIGFYYVPE